MSKEHPYKDTPVYKIVMKIFEYKTLTRLSKLEIDILKTLPKLLYEKEQRIEELTKEVAKLSRKRGAKNVMQGFMTQAELAEYFEVERSVIHKWAKNVEETKIPFTIYAGRRFFKREEVDEWLLNKGPGWANGKFREIHIFKKDKDK